MCLGQLANNDLGLIRFLDPFKYTRMLPLAHQCHRIRSPMLPYIEFGSGLFVPVAKCDYPGFSLEDKWFIFKGGVEAGASFVLDIIKSKSFQIFNFHCTYRQTMRWKGEKVNWSESTEAELLIRWIRKIVPITLQRVGLVATRCAKTCAIRTTHQIVSTLNESHDLYSASYVLC